MDSFSAQISSKPYFQNLPCKPTSGHLLHLPRDWTTVCLCDLYVHMRAKIRNECIRHNNCSLVKNTSHSERRCSHGLMHHVSSDKHGSSFWFSVINCCRRGEVASPGEWIMFRCRDHCVARTRIYFSNTFLALTRRRDSEDVTISLDWRMHVIKGHI